MFGDAEEGAGKSNAALAPLVGTLKVIGFVLKPIIWLFKALGKVVGFVWNVVKGVGKVIAAPFKAAWKGAKWVGGKIKEGWEGLKKGAKNVAYAVTHPIESTKKVAKAAWGGIKKAGKWLWGKIKGPDMSEMKKKLKEGKRNASERCLSKTASLRLYSCPCVRGSDCSLGGAREKRTSRSSCQWVASTPFPRFPRPKGP